MPVQLEFKFQYVFTRWEHDLCVDMADKLTRWGYGLHMWIDLNNQTHIMRETGHVVHSMGR